MKLIDQVIDVDRSENNMDPQLAMGLGFFGIVVMIVGIVYSSTHKTKRFANNRQIITVGGAILSIVGFFGSNWF